jgi:hypothetical protein
MKSKLLVSTLFVICLFATQAFALPNLYVNGAAIPETPVGGPNDDLYYGAGGIYQNVQFTLLYEETPHANKNTLFAHDVNNFNNYFTIFDDDDAVGATTMVNYIAGVYTHSLLNDLDDDGIFESGNDEVWLNTYRPWTLPSSSDYQWFRIYKTDMYGNANFFFGDGGGDLSFSGNFLELWFIDDDHVTGGNQDHNDMVVGLSVVPEPATMILLGLGLTGAGILRRRIKS